MFIVSYPLCAFDEHQTTTPAFQLQSTKTSLSTCGCTIRLAPAVATEVGTNHQMQHIAHVQQTVEAVYPSLRTNFLSFIQRCARGSTLANGRYWVFVLNWHDGAEKRQKSSVADVGSRNKDVVVFVGRVDFVPGVLGTRCSLLFASQTAVLLWVFFCWFAGAVDAVSSGRARVSQDEAVLDGGRAFLTYDVWGLWLACVVLGSSSDQLRWEFRQFETGCGTPGLIDSRCHHHHASEDASANWFFRSFRVAH